MFKVLVVAYYFPPMGLSGVQRTLKFVKYMSKYNWEPTVITVGQTGYFAHDISLQKELDETGIRVVRVDGKGPNSRLAKYGTIKMPGEFLRKLFHRLSSTFYIPDNKRSWSKKAAQKAREMLKEEEFDAIFVTSPPFSAFYELAKVAHDAGGVRIFRQYIQIQRYHAGIRYFSSEQGL